MNEYGMDEITRFERMIEPPSPPRQIAPPPISPEAMAGVAKANRLARSVSNELPLEWPQTTWVSRPVLAFAIFSVVGIAGALGYYIFSEGQAVIEKSRKSAEISDTVSVQSAAAVRESNERAPLPPPIPPTAPIRMGQWIPDTTSQGQGQPAPTYSNPQAIAAAPAPAPVIAQAQPQAQPQPQIQPQIQPQAAPVATAPRTLAQTAPQLNTQSITISAAAPVPATGEAQAQAPILAQPQIQAPIPAQLQAPVPIPVQPVAPKAPTALMGPQPPRIADPKALEPSLADEPAEGTPQPTPLVVRVRTKEARFHSGPGVQYPIIAVARAETRYAVADWSDRWFKVAIRLPSGTTMGWIRNDQVLITPGGASEKLPAFPESASNGAGPNDEIE